MRRHDRRRAEFPVSVRAAGNKVEGGIRLDTMDLSEGGAFLRSDLLFEVGETLELSITLPSGQQVKVASRVVRVSRRGDKDAGMGIEFINLTTPDRRAIAANLIKAGFNRAPRAPA